MQLQAPGSRDGRGAPPGAEQSAGDSGNGVGFTTAADGVLLDHPAAARARQEGRPAGELLTLYVLLRRGWTPDYQVDMYAY